MTTIPLRRNDVDYRGDLKNDYNFNQTVEKSINLYFKVFV